MPHMAPPSYARHRRHDPSALARDPVTCIFCDPKASLRATGEDPMQFRAHLAANRDCALEYQMWKQVITDEWLGD